MLESIFIKRQIFSVCNLFTFFKIDEIIVSKYSYLALPGVFSDKIIPDIDFINEAIGQCDIPLLKILFVGAIKLQMITNKF